MVIFNRARIPRVVVVFLLMFIPRLLIADQSVRQLYALGKINVWFAMQLPLFVEWPSQTVAQSPAAPLSRAPHVVSFCLDISDPQRHFFSEKKEVTNIGYEFDIKFVQNISQLDQCHILLIHKSQEHRLSSILLAIKNKPILTVSDIENFSEKGGMITLFVDKDRLHYICNLREARESGLKISSRMLDLADSVYE